MKVDARHYDDVQSDLGWDAVWEVGVRRDSLGWTAEFRIPFSHLRYARSRGEEQSPVWGVQFLRDIARYNERDTWSPMPPDAPVRKDTVRLRRFQRGRVIRS